MLKTKSIRVVLLILKIKFHMQNVLILLFICSISVVSKAQVLDHKNFYQQENIEIRSYDYKSLAPIFEINDDKTYVINFWATWCLPCIEELPAFEKLNQLKKQYNTEVILINLDFPKHIQTRLLPFIKKHNIQSKVMVLDDPDANTWINQIDEEWSGAIPATIIYNSKERKFFERSFTFDELIEIINDLK